MSHHFVADWNDTGSNLNDRKNVTLTQFHGIPINSNQTTGGQAHDR